MKSCMLNYTYKTFFILIILFSTYFFVELFIFKEKILSIDKYDYPGVETSCLVESDPNSTLFEGFGPDVKKGTLFRFHQKLCEIKEMYTEVGDIILWENSYFEVDSVVENQFLGGQPEKNYSLLCNGHMSRLSKLNRLERNA